MKKIRNILLLALVAVFPAAVVFVAAKPAATTLANLQAAFNTESNAGARYEAFAGKASEEGYAGVAGLFRAVALSESVHAANHAKNIKALGGEPLPDVKPPVVKSTKENLREAVQTERNESGKVYPAYVKQAVRDNNPQAVISLKGAMASEGGHARLFSQALKKLEQWKESVIILVCRTCGYTTSDLTVKFCPFCTQPRTQFAEVR